MNRLAPIILFVYNRLKHTIATIESLKANSLSSQSDLIIYSDAARCDSDIENVEAVRAFIDKVDGFKNIRVVKQKQNMGLAKSIIKGVSEVFQEYESVIVLEDDIVTSPNFLQYMNDSLATYQKEDKVWHVSGWNYPITDPNEKKSFFWRGMNCWGWATWKCKWSYFEKNPHKLVQEFQKDDIKKFNIDGYYDFWTQVTRNQEGSLDTWAIFWYATIFKNNGLCLNPELSYVKNIGIDGTGVNSGADDVFNAKKLNTCNSHIYTSNFVEDKINLIKIKHFFKSVEPSFLQKCYRKMKRMLGLEK